MCRCARTQCGAQVEVTGQAAGVGALLRPHGAQKSNLGQQAWWQTLLPAGTLFCSFANIKQKKFKGYLQRDGLNTKAWCSDGFYFLECIHFVYWKFSIKKIISTD